MPIYEYQCLKCGEVFEVFQKVSDPPPSKHSCGSRRVKRIMSQTTFVLKGSGWYITDYGRKDTGGAGDKKRSEGKEAGGDKAEPKKSAADKAGSDSGPKGSAAA